MKFSDVKGRGLNFLLVILAILLVSSFANETVTVWAQDGMDDDRLAAPASSIEYVDLNNWVWVAEGDANWVVEPGGRTVYQTVNSSSPCLYMSDVDIFNNVVVCEFEVKDTGDNDYVGFALGMNSPTDRISTNYEFILFDWKKSFQATTAEEGFNLVRVNGSFPSAGYGSDHFWNHQDTGAGATPEFDVLATDHGVGKGWVANQRYEVRILYTANRIKIVVDGATIFDQAGTYANGKLGFYCLSQEDVYFRSVKHAPGSDVEQPPVATDDSYNATINTTIDIDRFDGVISNDYDYNLDTFTIALDTDVSNGTLNLNADGSFSYTPNSGYVGTDSFTYHITDDDGDSNIATASIVVMTANEAPTDIQISNQKVPASPVNGQQVAIFTTTDPNVGDIHDYLILNNAGGRFGVSGDKLVIANASLISAVGVYNITVRTQDVGGLYYDEDFTIYGGDTATLRINTTPGTGQWRQTGTTSWNNSGDDLTIPADTNVSIEFNSVSGYDTPGNRTYNVSADSTETDTVVYTPQLGNLRVTTSPTSGQWRLVGSSVWSNSGDTISNIPVGVVQVEFNALVNYDTPANQNVTIAKNITSTANGVYVQHVGSVSVTTAPTSGKWRLVGTSTWRNSGDTVSGVVVGNVDVEFQAIADHDTPANQTLTVTRNATATATGTYIHHTGSLSVTTEPTSGKWRVVGTSTWMNSGDTVSDIEVGAVNIEFQDIADYDTPANQSVTITKDTTATASGTYVHHVGSVSVTTDPASGSWRIVGSSSWNNSGATVSNIEVGSVDIEFQAIADHDTPANQTLTVTNGGLVTASGIYVQHTGDLMVITDPANGGWRLSGETAWRNSGDTVTDIIVGNAVVEFKEVDGYFTPVNLTTAITNNNLTRESVSYVKKTGNLTITTNPSEGKWRIVGESTWNDSGATVADIPIGSVEIEFLSTYSHNAPANKTYVIESNLTTSDIVQYAIKVYRIVVHPAALGHTSHDGSTDVEWGRNLTIAANPDVNSKFVRWVGADVPPGQANSSYLYLSEISKNMEFTPVFAKDLASVTVNIDGPPASAWRIIGITGWMNGGVTVADIVPGTYTIEFQYVKGWVEPASLSIELSNGSKVTREGTYENIQEEYPPRIHYFTSTVEYISAGSEIRLEWFIQGGKAKSITNVGEVTGNVNYIDVRVDETTEFELTASNDNGISKAKTTIIVIEKPDIKFFVSSHNNENPLHAGEKAELSWFIKGADEVEIVGVEDEIPAGQVTSGTHIVSPETTTTYKLVAKNSFSRSEAVVSVPVTELPEIETFKSSHNVLPKGTTAKLKWKVKGVNFVTISPDIGEVKSSGSLKVKPEKDTTFTLEAENVAGKVSNELEMEVIDENFDLSVEILSIKQPVVVGKTSEVRVKVSNGGNTRADKVVVKLLDGKNPLKYFTINSIRAESSKIVKLNIVPTKAPKLILNAVVDPDNLIREKVEKNNRDSVAVVSEKVKGIDLLPRNIRIEEAEGMPEGTFVISYVITNVGSEDSSGFQCDVSVNTGLKGKFQFIFADEADELKPGKTTRFEREVFIEEAPAKLKVQVEVDSLKAIHESNENNNIVIQKR